MPFVLGVPTLGPMELIIILVIIVAIFGASKLAGIGGALGGSIREFKKAVNDGEEEQGTGSSKPRTDGSTEPSEQKSS